MKKVINTIDKSIESFIGRNDENRFIRFFQFGIVTIGIVISIYMLLSIYPIKIDQIIVIKNPSIKMNHFVKKLDLSRTKALFLDDSSSVYLTGNGYDIPGSIILYQDYVKVKFNDIPKRFQGKDLKIRIVYFKATFMEMLLTHVRSYYKK